jgi:hypothetical protein
MGQTVNVGNYESLRADVSIEERIDEVLTEAEVADLYKDMRERARKMLSATLKKMVEDHRS